MEAVGKSSVNGVVHCTHNGIKGYKSTVNRLHLGKILLSVYSLNICWCKSPAIMSKQLHGREFMREG